MKFRMNALHYALLAIVILLIVYYGTNLLREGNDDCTKYCPIINTNQASSKRSELLKCSGGQQNYYDYWKKTCKPKTKEWSRPSDPETYCKKYCKPWNDHNYNPPHEMLNNMKNHKCSGPLMLKIC